MVQVRPANERLGMVGEVEPASPIPIRFMAVGPVISLRLNGAGDTGHS